MEPVYFVTAKFSLHIFSPVNLFIFLILFGLYAHWMKWKRAANYSIGIGAFMLALLLLWPIGDPLISPLEKRFQRPETLPKARDIAGIILLGGGEDLVRSLSWATPNVNEAGERFLTAAWLARVYAHVPVIFSGGWQDETPQRHVSREDAWVVRLLLRQGGVPSRRIHSLGAGDRLYDQLRMARDYLKRHPLSIKVRRRYGIRGNRYILITSAYQMPRAVGVARKLGLKVVPYPVDYRSRSGAYRYIDFDFVDHLRSFEPAVSEWLALTYYYVRGRTDGWFPKP